MPCTECPRCEHWILEGQPYKSPPRNATYSPSKSLELHPTPSTPDNTPICSPCLPPPTIPLLQLRSEDSGNKEKLTTTLGKATTSSIGGEVTTTTAIPGTVARQWGATKIMPPTKTTTAIPGIPVQQWVVTRVKVIPRT